MDNLQSPQDSERDKMLLVASFSFVRGSFLYPRERQSLNQLKNALKKSEICTFAKFAQWVDNEKLTYIRNVDVKLLEIAREVVRAGKELVTDG